MEQVWVLLDQNSGLHVPWYFWLRVLDEVNRATRYGGPFGLLLLEAEPKPGTTRSAKVVSEAITHVPPAIRSTDLGGLLAPCAAGVLLTNQDTDSARQASDRILERMEASGATRAVVWRTELLTFPEHSVEIAELLTDGWSGAHRAGMLPSAGELKQPA